MHTATLQFIKHWLFRQMSAQDIFIKQSVYVA